MSTRVEYLGGAVLGSSVNSEDLVLANGIEGIGSLAIQNRAEIQGGITARGNLYIRNRAGAQISGPLDLAGEVFIDRSGLQLKSDIGAADTRVRIAPTFETAGASLLVSSSNTLSSIVLDPRGSRREGTFNQTRLTVEEDAVLTITDELRFMGGTIRRAIVGQSVLTKQDRTIGTLEDIAGSGFERINVEGGTLVVQGDAGATAPDIYLQSKMAGHIQFANAGVYRGDIYLNDHKVGVQIFEKQAALSIGGDTTIVGNVYLGEKGASVSGRSYLDTASFGSDAVIHGRDLLLRGRAPIRIRGGKHTYNGETKILAESLILIDDGRLNSTSAVIGSGRFTSGGGRGGLILDNTGSVANSDRIPDNTPVHLNGMVLTLLGRDGEAVTETLGTVYASRGIGDLNAENPNGSNGSTELRIQTLNRQPGGVVQFRTNGSNAKIVFAEEPVLADRLIGGWAIFDEDEFATYGPNGVVAYSDLHTYANDIATATTGDNVLMIGGSRTLLDNRSINSLTTNNADIDLNGNTLTIESGGMLARSFSLSTIGGPGELTAGTEAGAELLITGSFRVDANIVDNAQGAIGLTHSLAVSNNSAYLVLSGENTYSGPTVVNSGNSLAALDIVGENALPVGGDIFLNGGDLRINHQPSSPLQLGKIELRDAAIVRSTSGFTPQIQPTSILVESGDFLLEVVGDAPITKRGPLNARFERSLATHTGPILIEEGHFSVDIIGAAPLDDAHAVTVLSGGILHFNVIADRKIRLDGGRLYGIASGPLEILSGGGTVRNDGGNLSSTITGHGDLVVEGGFGRGLTTFEADINDFQGDLLFTGGVIHLLGDNTNYNGDISIAAANVGGLGRTTLGSGQVTVLPEGQLSIGDPVSADLRLKGGVLRFLFDSQQNSPTLDGSLTIADHSYLFIAPRFNGRQIRPQILSDLYLEDGSHLAISQSANSSSDYKSSLFTESIRITSDLKVEGVSTLTSFDTIVTYEGTITPASQNAVLNLVGNDTFKILASIYLESGNSLSINQDGEPELIQMQGASRTLTGNGTLNNDVKLQWGGSVSPGELAEELTVRGDVTLGKAAVYNWDMANSLGTAGADWDLLRVHGDLIFEATISAPWVLELSSILQGFQSDLSEPWLIASANSIQGFDPASVRVDISGITDAYPSFSADQFVVFADGGNLLLQVVPEPASWLMALIFAVFIVARRRVEIIID